MPIYGAKGALYMENLNSNVPRTHIPNADCVTETRLGKSILVVYGFYKPTTTVTAAEKMMRVLQSEIAEIQIRQRH